jgi:hypothetical protein
LRVPHYLDNRLKYINIIGQYYDKPNQGAIYAKTYVKIELVYSYFKDSLNLRLYLYKGIIKEYCKIAVAGKMSFSA